MGNLTTQLEEKDKLTSSMTTFTLENDRLMKENKSLSDNRTLHQNNLRSVTAALQQQINTKKASLQAEIYAVEAEYNRLGCVGSLPPDRYAYCQQMYTTYSARIEDMKRNGDALIRNMVTDLDRQHLEPIRNIIARQTVRIEQIADAMKSNFDGYTKAQEQQIAVQAKIAQIRAQLSDLCQNAPVGSASYQLCHGVNWDGTKTNLPPLTGTRRGTTVVPNQ
jgi:chromosome segregation ATPase